MHRAGFGRALHDDRRFRVVRDRHGDLQRQLGDAAWHVGGHDFFDLDAHAGDVDAERVCLDAHDCGHATRERGGDEVGGREAFAAALVVDGGIGGERLTRWAMGGVTVKLSFVNDVDGDHGKSYWKFVIRY